ncbi:hypothetical protein COF68_28230 [Bacillus toyonensis]|uniref:hypothetical protein n=1 Tax=Bacillus toyonensis TaxID=155322 RepID=UPI000BEDA280|nr:hypothetical protein [Bacillus toyonensis]PED58194.1 hypothetical protein CON89_27160 [Bacillus toyonensis]PEN40414.1 hypothetical protein CN541_09570 [Bacillus toyonensis]PEP62041.1 hypothetical protein CN574_18650 [Bacillus toyonensis]PFY05833.1 hypothetical protein COL43_24305 [Bacillus toyonensis]PHC54213.1 hypothetical protein COF34_23705 [Bacillus toyonensis]
MDSLELNKSKYIVSNIKTILHKKLILEKPLTIDEVKKLNLVNPPVYENEKYLIQERWFYSVNIGEWEDVEIIEMAEKIFDELHLHISRALKYLQEFFPNQEMKNYYLSTICFGKMVNFDDYIFSGFSLAFIFDGHFEFQYKVKFKEDGWPIGFEGGPL